MSALLTELRDHGCDVDNALVRFLNNEAFYAKCFKKFFDDPAFPALGDALREKNADAAFRQAHTLKGLASNMGLTAVHDMAAELVEPLRAGVYKDEMLDTYEKVGQEIETLRMIAKRSGI